MIRTCFTIINKVITTTGGELFICLQKNIRPSVRPFAQDAMTNTLPFRRATKRHYIIEFIALKGGQNQGVNRPVTVVVDAHFR